MSVIAFSRLIGPVPIDCFISEKPSAELLITEVAVETGAKITDHAVILPKKITLDIAAENAAAAYSALVAFQETREPFTLVTGLSVFPNMLIKRIDPERDATFSTVLRAKVDLQEIVIVGTAYAADPDGDSTGERGKPGGTKSTRAAAPSAERSKAGYAADRSTGTIQRGDAGVSTVPANKSVLSTLVGG
jgi:hypothetical protein